MHVFSAHIEKSQAIEMKVQPKLHEKINLEKFKLEIAVLSTTNYLQAC